jgi:hypothetical protein
VHFIQNMDGSQLSIDPKYFDECLTRAGEKHAMEVAANKLQQQQQQQQQQQPLPHDSAKTSRPMDLLDPFGDPPSLPTQTARVTESTSTFAPVATSNLIDLPVSVPPSGWSLRWKPPVCLIMRIQGCRRRQMYPLRQLRSSSNSRHAARSPSFSRAMSMISQW